MKQPDRSHQVSCIIPAYNEAGCLADTVAEWTVALARDTRDYEIIVVDDGSTDDSATLLRKLATQYDRLQVLTHATNVGYGAAVVDGFARARFPLLFFTDSDGQYDPADFRLLLDRIATADIVVGHRVRRADPWGRALLSRGYNALVRRIVGSSLRDVNCAFKLLHRDSFTNLGIASTGFSVNAELEMTARNHHMTIVEVPVRHRPRRAGRSTVRPFHVLRGLQELAWLRRRQRDLPAHDRSESATRSSVRTRTAS